MPEKRGHAQLEPLQDQISIKMKYNKVTKNDFHTPRDTADTCEKLEETQQTLLTEKKALTTEGERLKADALNLREWQEKKQTMEAEKIALEAEIQNPKVAAAEDVEIWKTKNNLPQLEKKKLEREAKSTPLKSP